MKYIIFLLALFVAVPALAADRPPEQFDEKYCSRDDLPQMDLNICAGESAKRVYAKLHQEVSRIEKLISERPAKLKAFKKAQQVWEMYMREQTKFLYFDHDGSAAPMCADMEFERLVEDRIRQLRDWVKGSVDNACGGGLTAGPD